MQRALEDEEATSARLGWQPSALREALYQRGRSANSASGSASGSCCGDLFHTVTELPPDRSFAVGYTPSTAVIAVHSRSGATVTLRRLPGVPAASAARLRDALIVRSGSSSSNSIIAGTCTALDVVTAAEMGPGCVAVYAAAPADAVPVRRAWLTGPGPLPHERWLWSLLTQLVTTAKAAASAGITLGQVDPDTVLLTARGRVIVDAAGLVPAIRNVGSANGTSIITTPRPVDDLVQIATLTSCVASRAEGAPPESLPPHYSVELREALVWLAASPRTFDQVARMLGPRLLDQLQDAHAAGDWLEEELGTEIHHGRLLRLVAKISVITERQDLIGDTRWSEHGDRYPVKLFRDYVFHQVDADGYPVVDLEFIISCLNKLDAGVQDRVLLSSRDSKSLLIAGYDDLRRCIAESFTEIKCAAALAVQRRRFEEQLMLDQPKEENGAQTGSTTLNPTASSFCI